MAIARRWLVLSFLVGFFVTGAMHWMLPYSEVQLPGTLMRAGLAPVVLAAVLARLKGRASFWIATMVVGASVPAAVGARVVVDTAADPTSHNLWPFEIVLGGMVGLGAAALGALLAGAWNRVTGRG